MELLERKYEATALERSLDGALGRSGRLVFVSGEAGIGKSVFVRSFCDEHRGTLRIWLGACDALFTPRPLAPFVDIAHAAGGPLADLTRQEVRPHELAYALLTELRLAPTIVVLEDLHWADEATLDVVSILSRRLGEVSALLLVTYRDDELPAAHPLRVVVGERATNKAVDRIRLSPLSLEAVVAMAGSSQLDPNSLYRRTGGNPFFVSEVLAAPSEAIPLNVREAVLARVARLDAGARALLNSVAVVPLGCEYWLLEELAGTDVAHLDTCLASGVLLAGPSAVSFRHELGRLTVEEELSPTHRARLHQRALAALSSRPAPDPARLAHHAVAAADAGAVARYAPDAGARASALGAHREAAAHYKRAIEFAGPGLSEDLADLYDHRAYACYLSGDFPAALEAQQQAVAHHRSAGDRLRFGRAARLLSLLLRYEGDMPQAWQVGREALAMLETVPSSHELALAYCNLSHLATASEDGEQARAFAAEATRLADDLSDVEAHIYTSINIGCIELLEGKPEGAERLQRSLQLALDHGFEEHAGRAYCNLVWWSPRRRAYGAVDEFFDPALRYTEERGLDLWRGYVLASRARADLDRCQWDEALELANNVLRNAGTSPVPKLVALAVVGLIRARRGDPGVWGPLDEAWALARRTGELQRMEPAANARAEAYWLEGRYDEVVEATSDTLQVALARRATWVMGEMLMWRQRAGLAEALPVSVPEPFASELRGDWEVAAERWRALDAPYEVALALGHADDEGALREGLTALQHLGAQPAAASVARRLRERGAKGLGRGPRPSTLLNPAQLTARELEVLAYLSTGLQNHEIAGRLFVSQRTVDHHVASILRKLGVPTRVEAVRQAARLGLAQRN
jgi:DNA-binding CsgD family transcriptional regulator/tetratricopeptide (TPR) repeat protein